ncbi:putative structural protein [Sphingomonas phage Eidolon]|uniref:Putative structural protein n=1 Tax=Sphingomonas phage Eidolon TaxID=2686311 RepID=A0A6M3T9U8_9CAUD|nr:putative structural protein [Sphingomonas phage Eidolon]QJD54403.1 putative structural protein [Sphingomonas phage Eidolon]
MATNTELYRFAEQATGLFWTYTSGNEIVSYDAGDGAEDYKPASISRTEAEVKNEISKSNIEVQIPLTNEVAVRWMQDNGEKIVSLTIFEREKNGTVSVVWKGRLSSILPDMTAVTLKMESIFTSLRRPGLRARYQRSCRHALYGRGCTLDPADFEIDGSVSAAAGRTFTIAAAAGHSDGYFVGGMLRAGDGTLSYVTGHVGNQITVQRLSFSLATEIAGGFPFDVKLYPGCDHSRATCNTKFANLPNYGGFDFIPVKNPLGGSSIV